MDGPTEAPAWRVLRPPPQTLVPLVHHIQNRIAMVALAYMAMGEAHERKAGETMKYGHEILVIGGVIACYFEVALCVLLIILRAGKRR